MGAWLMVDKVTADIKGPGRAWGKTTVNPGAWFFKAHFPQDPVWPGSLGLEGFLQVAKFLWAAINKPDIDPGELKACWQAPVPGQSHQWLYRGQIIPFNKDVTFGLKVASSENRRLALTGLLWVDNQVVYQVDNLTVSATNGP
jgi:3-hydroxymyristoyl/3-hydroxydecanoyl-(acyl carrier protein) dehydratase